ncbi:MAG: response regulator transcription factor [Planctomycetes bacterium]|nr:response regulator transcription factor [Planctomycetota bacterium]
MMRRNTRESLPAPVEAASPRAAGGTLQPKPRPQTQSSAVLRVLCVDDHVVLVEGLKAHFAIKGDIEIVGRMATAANLADAVARLKPHVVMLDIEMPGPDAFEMADRMRRKFPEVRIIVLSAHIRDSFISASFRAGVSAYFAKSDDLEDIVKGIFEVAHSRKGSFVLGPKVRERCTPVPLGQAEADSPDARTGDPRTLLNSLTPREDEILRLVGKGMSRNQIAAQLCRSVKTIDAHQGRMMRKLGIGARADLIRFAIREGLAMA